MAEGQFRNFQKEYHATGSNEVLAWSGRELIPKCIVRNAKFVLDRYKIRYQIF